MSNNFNTEYNIYKQQLNDYLQNIFYESIPSILKESMNYSLTNGGKRLRGVIILAICDLLNVEQERALRYAAAIEMIHAYSLIHDDMPCMDNDTLRRGKPCNHIVYGEGNALLAGDGLLNFAYEILLDNAKTIEDYLAIKYLASSAGVTGMIKGQSMDILNEGKEIEFDVLKDIHSCKTGALIQAAITIPAILNGEKDINSFESFGKDIGIAFQIIDDVLDVIGNTQQLGKTVGKDEACDKTTYVKFFGVQGAKQMANETITKAICTLENIYYNTDFLRELAISIVNRSN